MSNNVGFSHPKVSKTHFKSSPELCVKNGVDNGIHEGIHITDPCAVEEQVKSDLNSKLCQFLTILLGKTPFGKVCRQH